jgi:alanine racemase
VNGSDATVARMTVDLDAVAHNYAALGHAAGSAVAPVVKGDAYGVGMAAVADRLWMEGARTFHVARLVEGEQLRRVLEGRQATIYVLDGASPQTVQRLVVSGLTPVLNSPDQIAEWRKDAPRHPAAVHVDTGMNRLGLRIEEAEALAQSGDCGWIDQVMSHLACGGEPGHPMNGRQADAFAAVRGHFPDAPASLANTAGAFLGERFRYDQARPGVGLMGGGPFERPHPAIRTVATLEAPILQVRTVRRGETIGYGASYTATRTLEVAILAAGFADGVLRALGAGGYGWLAGQARPFLGRISMDLIAIDVTDCKAARPGEWVELLGANVLLDDVAKRANTVPYEILTRTGWRVPRTYTGARTGIGDA